MTIDVSIPPGLGQNFIPITAQMVTFSNNTATIEIIDTDGCRIVYTVNSSDVPLFTEFSPDEIYNFSIARGNSSDCNDPIFLGCNSEGECVRSTAKNPLEIDFSISGVNLALVLPLTILGVAAICIAGGVWYVKVELPRSNKRVALYDWTVRKKSMAPKPAH